MASSRRSEPISSNPLVETPFHFFKVILPATLEDKKLRIPEKFVRKFRDELSAVVTLTVPNGRIWHVQLTKDEKNIWLHDGWHDFVKYHSICAGHFLVFKYGKNSNFHVLIFDKTACEIQYPYYFGGTEIDEQNSLLQDEMKIDDSIEIMGFTTPNLHSNSLKNKVCDKCQMSSSKIYALQSQHPNNPDSSTQDELEEEIELNTSFYESALPRKRTMMAVERERTFNAAKVFEPVNPFCRVVLRPSYLYRKCIMYFPSYFAKKYLRGVSGFIKLQTSDGKQRPVRCVYRGGSAKLTQGWYGFVLENNLGEGDVCVFEVLRSIDIVLKVTVFRDLESAEFANQLSSGSVLGSNRFQKHVASHENPKFRHGIEIRSKRCKIEVLDEINKLDAVGDEIENKRAVYKVGQHSLGEENNRIKCDEHELLTLLGDMEIYVSKKFRYIKPEERERAFAAARMLKPKHPSFMVILQPDNLKNRRVYVPSTFGDKYLSKDSKSIQVQDSDGREWSFLILWCGVFCIKRWTTFYKEKNLGEGDICIFELIRVKEPLLKVSIFYASTK
ncbi:hypothetical protein ACOSP7_005401 [Xanthoceras sorbifolium]